MKLRRGTDFWPGELGKMIHQYRPGDIVTAVITGSDDSFTGVVRDVQPKLNKVLVAWGGGSVVQHDPDEIMLHPYASEFIRQRLDEVDGTRIARRVRKAAEDLLSPFPISEFVSRFLEVYDQFYLFHWQTSGFAQHLAFE